MSLKDALLARARALGQELEDGARSAVYLRQLMRGNRARRHHKAPATRPAVGGPPVLLVHGYLATRGSLHLLEQRLEHHGHVVFSYRMGLVNLGDIRDSAGLIARKVESVVAQTGVDTIDLVGHSMGGLVGLYYVKRLGGRRRVRRLVLLGTPAQGTWSAVLGLGTVALGRASLQLLPGSPFLRELTDGAMPDGVEVVTIAGQRDWFAPVRSTWLAGARHIELPTGHSGLLVADAVGDTVSEVLREAPRATDRPPTTEDPTGER